LPKKHERIFGEAIVEPDRWRRKNPRSKHHSLRFDMILSYIMNARVCYVRGDVSGCLWLGIALHFVQDACIPSPKTKYKRRMHSLLEEKMKLLPVPEEEIDAGFSSSLSSPKFVEERISRIK